MTYEAPVTEAYFIKLEENILSGEESRMNVNNPFSDVTEEEW